MKPQLLLLALLAFTSSCYQSADDAALDQTSTVRFSFDAFGASQQLMTRAALVPSQLLIIDSYNGKAEAYTQNSLAEMPIPLTWGQHELYFVASSTPLDSYDVTSLTVSWPNTRTGLETVWAKKLTLEVSASTASQTVNLPLISANVKVQTLDNMPANTGDFKIEAPDLCRGLKLTDMTGFVLNENIAPFTLDMRPYAGDNNLTLNLYTLVPASKSVGDITLTAYDATATTTEMASHTLSNVPVEQGYISNYTGYFFSDGVALSFTCDPSWTGTHDYDY